MAVTDIENDPRYKRKDNDSRNGLLFGIGIMLAGTIGAGLVFWLFILPHLG